MKTDERIKTLMSLGLTFYQAKSYLALLQKSPATIKDIAEISKIARPDLYRVIATLQKQGVVEKLITKPASFQATAYMNVLPILLRHKQIEQDNLRKRTEELIFDLNNNVSGPQEIDNKFAIIHGKHAVIQRLKEVILKTQSSVQVVTSKVRFQPAILEFSNAYRKVIKRGVNIKIATERQPNVPQGVLKIIRKLSETPNFEVKYFDCPPEAIVAVFDNTEACVTLSATARFSGASAIWSNNPCFVTLAKNYFETQWKAATRFSTKSS